MLCTRSRTSYYFTIIMTVAATITIALLPKLAIASALLRRSELAPAQSYTISGTVRDYDGTPLAGQLVSTRWGDPEIAMVNTDDQGRYSLAVATPGVYHIVVSRFYNVLDPVAQTVTVPPSQTTVDFTFAQYETIRGVVTDPDGQTVAGATVTTDYMDPLYTSTLSDAGGSYVLAVTPGIYHVSASLLGLVSPPAQRVTVPPSHTDINFAFFVPYSIQGTVYTFDGRPASGVTVASSEDDPMAAYTMTDADGTYTLLVRAGTYHIYAYMVGLGTTAAQAVTVPSNRTGVDFAMPQQYLIHGTVRDDAGRPIAGAHVNEGSASGTTTAADGSYTLSLVAGEHWISVYSDDDENGGYDKGKDIVLVSVPPTAEGVDFVLRVRNRTIRGRVVDNQGQPVALADVIATNPINSTGQATQTAADGTYAVTVPAGVYWVKAIKRFDPFDTSPSRLTAFEPARSQSVDVTNDSAQAIDLLLKPVTGLLTIRGQVRTYQGGPVNAIVSAISTDPNNCSLPERVSTDASGTYTMKVKPGHYSVGVFSDGLPELASQNVTLSAASADDTVVDFAYPQLYSISGRVTDDRNKPLRYVLMRATTDAFSGLYNSTLTDSDGWYRLLVAAGAYTVTAYDQAFSVPPAQTVIVLPEQDDINFVLSRLAPPDHLIQGKVVDETGQPAVNAVLTLAGEPLGGKTVYYNGTFSRAVYAGTYMVSASGAGYAASASQQVIVPPDSTNLSFIVRRADQSIYGEVTDEAGNPLCGVNVQASGEAASATVLTDNSGRFAMAVPSGGYSIRATAVGYPATAAQTVSVPPTATQLRFVVGAAANAVEGTVRDDHDAAIANVTVVAKSQGGTMSTTTDANGKYTLHLTDGNWSISVSGAGLSAPDRAVTVPPQQNQVDFAVTRLAANSFVYLPAIER